MIARMRTTEDLLATVACFFVAGASLALGMWIAGHPLTAQRAETAGPIACATGTDCAGVDRLAEVEDER